MLAYLKGPRFQGVEPERSVGASLGLFAGIAVVPWQDGDRLAWQLPRVGDLPDRSRRPSIARLPRTQPARLPDGSTALVHGWIDNCRELAKELGCPAEDQALVFAHAVRAWGDRAESRILGTYCAIFDDPAQRQLRLSRSPFHAPPLYYARLGEGLAAASVPRALEAMGLPRELNPKRLADSLYFNLTEEESYLKGCYKVPYGTVVKLEPAHRTALRFHDPNQVPPQPRASAQDYIREADRLLEEGCRLYRDSARAPGILLSAGLDSSNVAARVLRGLPPGRRLNTFTYVPLAGHGQAEIPGGLVDEGPAVRAFCALHPQLEPHFVDNRAIEFDHRLEDMYLAMGTGTVNLAVFFRYHGLYQAAARHGCDMLLSADYGNFTFSASGSWSPAEYLRHLRLRQLWQTLRGERRDGQGFLTRLLVEAVMPVLPDGLWRLGRRLRGLSAEPDNLTVSALRQDAIERYSVSSRAAQAGTEYLRSSHASRADMVRDNFARGDVEGSDIGQGFEQLYEISTRDPTTYGPFVDFCLGLPTEMFRRDGETRWLARELGRGLMPEAQRTMPGHGQHNSDWHLRLTPRLEDMRRDIEAIREDPILAEMIDTQLLLDSLDNWPATQSVDDSVFIPHGFRLPRAVAMGRFVRFMSGRNA